MKRAGIAFGLLSALSLAAAWIPQQQNIQKERLRVALKDNVVRGNWIYDDISKGFTEAKRTGKPLMVVIRCVP